MRMALIKGLGTILIIMLITTPFSMFLPDEHQWITISIGMLSGMLVYPWVSDFTDKNAPR